MASSFRRTPSCSAERSGMVREIDMWVTRQAIRLIDEQRRAGRDLHLEVNLSGRTLGDPTLPRAIQDELRKVPIDPGNLIFEVTETTAVLTWTRPENSPPSSRTWAAASPSTTSGPDSARSIT